MACVTTAGLALDCRDSVGGIETLYIAAADAIVATGTNGAVALTSISLDGTAVTSLATDFSEYELLKQTGNVSEAGTFSYENGTMFYTQTLNAIFNKLESEKLNEAFNLAKGKVCVIAKDNNGKYFLIGNDNGAFVSAHTAESGTAYGDRNGITIGFTGISKQPMFEVTVTP
jgi:alpha-tubulin suppressor-like RCC1 family protein